MQGICSSFRCIDLSVGTENYLKREEYSEYKQVLSTFMFFGDSWWHSAPESSNTQRRQLPLPCGVLSHAMTDYDKVDVMLCVVPENNGFITRGSFKVLNFSAIQEIPLFSWTWTRIRDFTEVPYVISSPARLNLVHNLALFIFAPTLITSFRLSFVWLPNDFFFRYGACYI